jgi:dimethylglycine dehydrogenase
MTPFAKYEVSGPGANLWLDGLVANRLPRVGRIGLVHLLSRNGGVRAEFTMFREEPERFYIVGPGALERHDWDYLAKRCPEDGSVDLRKVTEQYGVLVIAGPRSRDVLQKLTDTDLSNAAFPWLAGKQISIGAATVRALRVNLWASSGGSCIIP